MAAPKTPAALVNPIPFSWSITDWPKDVPPYNSTSGRRIVRVHQEELLKCGALCRIGNKIDVLGAGYAKFLATKSRRVEEFIVPANLPEHAGKRFGGPNGEVKGR